MVQLQWSQTTISVDVSCPYLVSSNTTSTEPTQSVSNKGHSRKEYHVPMRILIFILLAVILLGFGLYMDYSEFSSTTTTSDGDDAVNGYSKSNLQQTEQSLRALVRRQPSSAVLTTRRNIKEDEIDSEEFDYRNNSHLGDLTVEDVMRMRSMNLEDIPMCEGGDLFDHEQYRSVIDSLGPNLVHAINRCEIRKPNTRGDTHDFVTMLSGDPMRNETLPIGFIHVFKWPLNYVGNVTHVQEDLFHILYAFYWNGTKSESEARKIYDGAVSGPYRDRHSKAYLNGKEQPHNVRIKGKQLMQYQLEVDDLSDEDVQRVCDLYWMDYLCVPFEIPKACSLEEMILKHYGSDFRYKECWSYETREFDDGYIKKYKEKDFTKRKKYQSKHQSRPLREREYRFNDHAANSRRRPQKRERPH